MYVAGRGEASRRFSQSPAASGAPSTEALSAASDSDVASASAIADASLLASAEASDAGASRRGPPSKSMGPTHAPLSLWTSKPPSPKKPPGKRFVSQATPRAAVDESPQTTASVLYLGAMSVPPRIMASRGAHGELEARVHRGVSRIRRVPFRLERRSEVSFATISTPSPQSSSDGLPPLAHSNLRSCPAVVGHAEVDQPRQPSPSASRRRAALPL